MFTSSNISAVKVDVVCLISAVDAGASTKESTNSGHSIHVPVKVPGLAFDSVQYTTAVVGSKNVTISQIASNGTNTNVTGQSTFTSDNPTIATVNGRYDRENYWHTVTFMDGTIELGQAILSNGQAMY